MIFWEIFAVRANANDIRRPTTLLATLLKKEGEEKHLSPVCLRFSCRHPVFYTYGKLRVGSLISAPLFEWLIRQAYGLLEQH